MNENKKIVDCIIVEGTKYGNMICVRYEETDGWHALGCYYPDELYYGENEVIGLTKREAKDLMHQKDVAYLRS
jgi:hypothetical protein